MIVRALLAGSILAVSFVSTRNADAMGDAQSYMSSSTSEKPRAWMFNTPEQDARPGEYFFLKAADALSRKQYRFAIDMYETSASWAYKPAAYNLAVMYFKGEGVAADRPRAMAWIALAAERNDAAYIDAREAMYADLSAQEFARANEIWRELKKTYGDDVALPRAKTRWAEVRAAMTGSRVGAVGNLKVGAMGSNTKPVAMSGARSALDGNTFSAFGVLTGGSMDGSTAYEQLRASDNPYDPKFRQDAGTATVESLIPLQNTARETPAQEEPHNL